MKCEILMVKAADAVYTKVWNFENFLKFHDNTAKLN